MSVPRAVQRRGGADGDEAGCAHQILFVPVRMPDAPKRGLVIRARRQIEAHNGVDVAVALEAPQHPLPNVRPVAEPVRLDRRMARCGSLGHSRRKLGQVDADAAAAVCLGSCRRCRTDYGSAAVSAARPRPSADVPTLSRATVGAERTVWMQPAALGLVAKGRLGDGEHGQQVQRERQRVCARHKLNERGPCR